MLTVQPTPPPVAPLAPAASPRRWRRLSGSLLDVLTPVTPRARAPAAPSHRPNGSAPALPAPAATTALAPPPAVGSVPLLAESQPDPPTRCPRCNGVGCYRCDWAGVTGELFAGQEAQLVTSVDSLPDSGRADTKMGVDAFDVCDSEKALSAEVGDDEHGGQLVDSFVSEPCKGSKAKGLTELECELLAAYRDDEVGGSFESFLRDHGIEEGLARRSIAKRRRVADDLSPELVIAVDSSPDVADDSSAGHLLKRDCCGGDAEDFESRIETDYHEDLFAENKHCHR